MLKTFTRLAFRLTFGLIALAMGLALILWGLYNEFIYRFPQYTGMHWWEPFGIGPAMIATGVYWLKTLRQPQQNERSET